MVNFTHRLLCPREMLPYTHHCGGLVRTRPGLDAEKEHSTSARTEIQ